MSKRYVVAVSGGVDSIVLLHMLQQRTDTELIVAHFDHGIRDDSAEDAIFVAALAKKYDIPFYTAREELGPTASEELARARRYAFLRSIAKDHQAQLVTAHHADDGVETIAINITRGTGWRGLAVLDSDVFRPLMDTHKADIRAYAKKHQLAWREDSTNASDLYLRNRIRERTAVLGSDDKRQLLALRAHQIEAKKQIDKEVHDLIGDGPSYSRYFFIHTHPDVARECLRSATQARLTRPQLVRALHAIKTAKSSTKYEAGNGIQLVFTPRNFIVELIK